MYEEERSVRCVRIREFKEREDEKKGKIRVI